MKTLDSILPEKQRLCNLYGQYIGFGSGGGAGGVAIASASLLAVIQDLSLDTSLEVCLDFRAHDTCWDGGQTISDLSGGSDWTLGNDSSSSTDDPSAVDAGEFNIGSYMLFDGGDFIECTAQDAWQNTIHKDAALWSCFVVMYNPSDSAEGRIFSSSDGTANPQVGANLSWTSVNGSEMQIRAASAAPFTFNSATKMTEGDWATYGLSLNENGGEVSFEQINGNNETAANAAYTSPSSSSADYNLVIGAVGKKTAQFLPNGTRIAMIAFWTRALSTSEMTSLFDVVNVQYTVPTAL
jgi:hypothetical protein